MPQFDPQKYAYPSRRNVIYARRAMACTSVPLGAQIGLDVMKAGGNAVDAAVAMAAAMPLLEPTGNGLGSDCFALVWVEKEKKLYGLNASGVAPMALSAEKVRSLGYTRMPEEGWLPAMVPGAPAGWAELNRRFGTKPLTELFAPAASYAREGCPVPVNVEPQWVEDAKRIAAAMERDPAPHACWWKSFMKEDGSPYRAGDLFRWEEYADTLEELAATGCESYYRGTLMEKIVAFSRETGGYFSEDDFRNYRPEWVEPITADYKGYTVCELPPNGHGITVLMALNILKGLELPAEKDCADTYHKILEAIKLAFADTKTYVADPRYMKTSVEDMLSEEYAARRRALITGEALTPEAGDPSCGGTIYLCTADPQGNMVSFIQSNYTTFGAGVAVPGTGISLQNRGANFSLDPDSDNCLAGGKRSYHTIIPGFMLKDGEAVGPFGVMGAFMQPQGHVLVAVNTIDYHMNPQECLDAPRMQWVGGKHIQLEREVPAHVGKKLAEMGHEVEVLNTNISMGRGQIIWRTDNGLLAGGTEPRCDGTVAAW
ncbi:gamma-glutamyltransferase family protein [Pseudoflavonifractor phocaeensis]|uniref:gamma-glutamyltransferase family protein n=1 Tax=Pseudoflavonifractor phocaeensis TaxID=1870988 RepID=UPI001F1EFA4D|nr:gamma-glutamyltransferase family protein [Pseudoflavonifractor phocaeensis]MCF2595919.1 gamma-glutamyltransferase family protein [Pseudoflavonifractor phocaeensis]